MRSQQPHHLFIVLLLLVAHAGIGGAAPPKGSSQGEHSGAMQAMPAGSAHETPMADDGAPPIQAAVRLSPEQRQMIGVTSAPVAQTTLKKTIRAVGRVDFDERRLADVTL